MLFTDSAFFKGCIRIYIFKLGLALIVEGVDGEVTEHHFTATITTTTVVTHPDVVIDPVLCKEVIRVEPASGRLIDDRAWSMCGGRR